MYPNTKEEVCEREGNVYFDLISECKIGLNKISNKLGFISSVSIEKSKGQSMSPIRTELEGELQGLLSMINDIRENIIK